MAYGYGKYGIQRSWIMVEEKLKEQFKAAVKSQKEENNIPKVDFNTYIIMLGALGMQQMGKMKNPITNEMEKDFIQASHTIELLELLEEKTSGNLSEDEEKVMKSTLTNLRLTYVEEVNKEKK